VCLTSQDSAVKVPALYRHAALFKALFFCCMVICFVVLRYRVLMDVVVFCNNLRCSVLIASQVI
jgi:hypothetical protein